MSKRQKLGLVWVILGTGWMTAGVSNEWATVTAIGLFLFIAGSFMFQTD